MEIAELVSGTLTEFSREKILALEDAMRAFPELPAEARPVRHLFAPGLYLREVFIPEGVLMTGRIHKHEHICMVLGDITIYSAEGLQRITGCETFVSPAGVKRAVVTHAPTWVTNVHPNPTDERDIARLEAMFTVESYAQLEGAR